jgi:hypothetical protein
MVHRRTSRDKAKSLRPKLGPYVGVRLEDWSQYVSGGVAENVIGTHRPEHCFAS